MTVIIFLSDLSDITIRLRATYGFLRVQTVTSSEKVAIVRPKLNITAAIVTLTKTHIVLLNMILKTKRYKQCCRLREPFSFE